MFDAELQTLGLDELLENDLTSYEYYNSLPEDIRRRIKQRDFGSFGEMSSYVSELRKMRH